MSNGERKDNLVGEDIASGNLENKLDLGLDSLLNPSSQLNAAEAELQSLITKASVEGLETSEPLESELSEFASLAKTGDWNSLLAKSEQVLESQQAKIESPGAWLEAQSWWIIAQTEQRSLPAAVLLAPLESMLDYLVTSTASSQQSSNSELDQNKLEAGKGLVKQAAARLADRFFSQSEMQSGMQLLSRVRLLGGDLEELKNIVQKYSRELNALQASEHRFYQILCKELSIDPKNQDLGSGRNAAIFEVSDSSSPSELSGLGAVRAQTEIKSTDKSKRKSPNSVLRLAAVLFLILIIVSLTLWLNSRIENRNINFPLRLSKSEPPVASLELPAPAPLNKISELDAVLYGLETKNKEGQQVNKVASTTQNIVTPKPRQPLNTNGPLESPEVRDLREKSVPKESKDSNDRNRPEIRVPGPAQAPRFESFPKPRIFEVNRATNLMLKPSLSSDAVAGLKRGDRIKVVGIAGYWLKVISRQGREAYVLAEDAEPSQ